MEQHSGRMVNTAPTRVIRRNCRKFLRNYCSFCSKSKRNLQYSYGHTVRNADGTNQCPFLRAIVCPICKATGDFAHTRKYCPYKATVYCEFAPYYIC